MNKKEAIELIDEAITMSFKYYPDDDWQPVVSTRMQLNYIKSVLENKNDRNRLEEINIGLYAVREFEVVNDNFADMIYKVCNIVELMKRNKI